MAPNPKEGHHQITKIIPVVKPTSDKEPVLSQTREIIEIDISNVGNTNPKEKKKSNSPEVEEQNPKTPPAKTKKDPYSKNQVIPTIGSTSDTGEPEKAKQTTHSKPIDPGDSHYAVNAAIVSIKGLPLDANLMTVKKISNLTGTCKVGWLSRRIFITKLMNKQTRLSNN